MDKKKKISLLEEKPLGATTWGRFVNWLAFSGRGILVFTELIVLLAFVSRFWLDAKNNDLGEIVRQKKVILESSSQFEKDFLELQKRLNLADAYFTNLPELENFLNIIVANLPAGISLNSFNFVTGESTPRANIDIYILSEEDLALFINNLTKDERVAKVRVGKIEQDELGKGTDIKLAVDFNVSEK
jgi:predicted Zn-dependent protease